MATYNIRYVDEVDVAPELPYTAEQEEAIAELREAYRIQGIAYRRGAPATLKDRTDNVFYDARMKIENKWPNDYERMCSSAYY